MMAYRDSASAGHLTASGLLIQKERRTLTVLSICIVWKRKKFSRLLPDITMTSNWIQLLPTNHQPIQQKKQQPNRLQQPELIRKHWRAGLKFSLSLRAT